MFRILRLALPAAVALCLAAQPRAIAASLTLYAAQHQQTVD